MAAFSGRNSDEWAGPKNPLGQAQFHIYQSGREVASLGQAYRNGGPFTVVQYYNPSEAEIAQGITTRQHVAEVFSPTDYRGEIRSAFAFGIGGILGVMYALRRERMTTLRETDSGPPMRNLDAFLGED